MARLPQAILWSVVLLVCLGKEAQGSSDYIVTVRRTGVIDFIDPTTLKTLSSITVDVTWSGSGLNGVFANPDGRTIYIEGPIGRSSEDANGCCRLYSIDLATLQTKVVAGIWGTRSRLAFIMAGPGVLRPVPAAPASAIKKSRGDQWQSSPDGRWWFGLRNGPAVDLFDVAQGTIVRSLGGQGLEEPWWASGTWLGNRFYIYATHHGSSRLWALTPESTQLGDGVEVAEPGQISACRIDAVMSVIAAGDRLLVYEIFGSKIDRRDRCDGVPGGAWIVDPASGLSTGQLASDLYFWMLIPNRAGSELYGITSEVPDTQSPAELVRVDAHNGNVLQRRPLESDYWWITTARLQRIPSGNVPVALAADDDR
jgi:hypothetical protein